MKLLVWIIRTENIQRLLLFEATTSQRDEWTVMNLRTRASKDIRYIQI